MFLVFSRLFSRPDLILFGPPWRFHNPFELVVDLWTLLNTLFFRFVYTHSLICTHVRDPHVPWWKRNVRLSMLPSTGSPFILFIQIKCVTNFEHIFSWSRLELVYIWNSYIHRLNWVLLNDNFSQKKKLQCKIRANCLGGLFVMFCLVCDTLVLGLLIYYRR